MTRRFRRFIFWGFFILFAFASIIIIFFAQGWNFNFESFKVVKTGGIFIKTTIAGAKIYVNDEYSGSTAGILNYTKLVDNLIPKNYNIFIHKDEYYPWNKSVEVKDGLVTELVSVALFPLDIKKIKVIELPAQKIWAFDVSDKTIEIANNKKTGIKIYDINGQFISSEKIEVATSTLISPDRNKELYAAGNEIWIDYLSDIKEEPSKKAGEKEIITTSQSPILFFDWLKDSEHVIWFTNGELTIAERDNRGGKRNSVKYYLNITPPVFWDNENSSLYFFEKSKEKIVLYKINIE